eukprot:CAMPEP_0117423632 /NCGR_PEP_ID=MMETSP0758-20121206/4205_1 /TAXON_ID=63605 /ORGANISM="Percolomonas cosmopolitus, Strain AE-1 (ATCC 50343)" /LENGTH=331 /DNA_ID=CAMNT_0005206913 /DNA_START=372 /DNA_END=1364 /DNA_ORIENTATION=-
MNLKDIQKLKDIVGSSNVLTSSTDTLKYRQDWTSQFKSNFDHCVIKPSSTAEVSAIMEYASKEHIAVVPQGGNTGLVGGGVPFSSRFDDSFSSPFFELILSMERMNRILDFDKVSGSLNVEAGCVLESLSSVCEEHGFMMPLDLGSKGSCQIGGNVATNAGGLRFGRYGSLHSNVLGLTVVLADGRVLSNRIPLRKDNTGYDLNHLFIGSEGTLGIITNVMLSVPPSSRFEYVLLFGLNSFEEVQSLFAATRQHELSMFLSAFEFWDASASSLVSSAFDLSPPFSSPFFVLLETRGSMPHDHLFESFMETVDPFVLNAILASSSSEASHLW